MGTGKKNRRKDIDLKTTFDFANDMAFDSELFVKRFFQIFPYFQIFRPLPRHHDAAALPIGGVEVDVDIVAHFDLDVALTVGEFLDGNLSSDL